MIIKLFCRTLLALLLCATCGLAFAQNKIEDEHADEEHWGLGIPDPAKPDVFYDGDAVLFRQVKNDGHSTSLVEWRRVIDGKDVDTLKGIGLLNLRSRCVKPESAKDYFIAANFKPNAFVMVAHYYQPDAAKPDAWKGLVASSMLIKEPNYEVVLDKKLAVEAGKPIKFKSQETKGNNTISYVLTPMGKDTYSVLASLGSNSVPPGKPTDYTGIAMRAPDGSLVIAFGDKNAAISLHLMHHNDWYSSWEGEVLFHGLKELKAENWYIH